MTVHAYNSNLLFTCFQQVFGCSSPGDMSTNYHQPTPQMRSREYDAGLWNYRGPLPTVAGYIKGPASGRTISFIDRTIHEAFLSDQLARVHNLRANNSIAMEYPSQNSIKTLWVPTFLKLLGQMNTSMGRRKATVPNCLHPPHPPTGTTRHYDSRKNHTNRPEETSCVWRNKNYISYGSMSRKLVLTSWRMLLSSSAFRYATVDDAPMLSISENRFQKIPPARQLSAAQPSFSPMEMKVLEAKKKMTSSRAEKGSFTRAGGGALYFTSVHWFTHTHTRL